MGRYLARRLLQFIPVLIGTLFLLHYLTAVSIQYNGNPVQALFGAKQPPPSVLAAVTRDLGLDDPCLTQELNPCLGLFVERMGNYITLDFGSNFFGREIIDIMAQAWPVTLRLTIIAVAFEVLIGIIAGVFAGVRKDKFMDNLVRFSTVLLISVPVFVLGVLVQIGSGLYIGEWLEDRGAPEALAAMFSVTYQSDYPWLSLVVPGFVLGAFSLASIARLTRTSLIENLRSDYVRTAKAKGLTSSRVVGIHTLRNSLIPVVTYIGVDIGALMAGAVVTEGIFNIPGVGGAVFFASRQTDVAVILPVVTLLTLVFLVANLFVDLLYAVLDPRIRYD